MSAREKRIRPNSLQTNGRRRATTRFDYIKVPGFGYILKKQVKYIIAFLIVVLLGYTFCTFGLYELFSATGRL